MRTLTLQIPEPGDDCMFDVIDQDGRRCNSLGWDEMLGQVAMLTMPPSRLGNGFRMDTPEGWAKYYDKKDAQLEKRRAAARAEEERRRSAIAAMADALRQWQVAERTDDGTEFANAQQARDAALDKASLEGLA